MPTRNFRYEFIQELLESVGVLHVNQGHSEAEGSYSNVVFYTKDDGKHWRFYESESTFHNWDDDQLVECDEVVEHVISVKTWKKV